jgi:beta-glucosidase
MPMHKSQLFTAVAVAAAQAAGANQTVEERLAALLPTLTLEEKVWQLVAPGYGYEAAYREQLDRGYGLSNVRFRVLTHSAAAARAERDRLQAYALNHSRLGLPLSFISEGLVSGGYGATNFPTPQALSLTWNTSLAEAVHSAIATQARAQGADAVFGPVINVFPDPRFGRLCEGWGAEPMLTARFAAAAVRGLQGPPEAAVGGYVPRGKVISIGKHFLGYGDTRGGGGLNAAPIDVSPRTLRERYVPPSSAFCGEPAV